MIPLIILNACSGKPLPVYGDGQDVRDWLYVEDHCRAIRTVLAHGRVGELITSVAAARRRTLISSEAFAGLFYRLRPKDPTMPHEKLITFVNDRPGHYRRYAMNTDKIESELGWHPTETFESGLEKTVRNLVHVNRELAFRFAVLAQSASSRFVFTECGFAEERTPLFARASSTSASGCSSAALS